MAAFLRAAPTVGFTPRDRFDWLLGFVDRALTGAGIARGVAEVATFVYGARPVERDGGPTIVVSPEELGVVFDRDAVPILQLQHDAQRLLGRVRAGESIAVPVEKATMTSRGVRVEITSGNARTRFRRTVEALLAGLKGRVHSCADDKCGKLFWRVGRRKHCSKRCGDRVRAARHRHLRPDRRSDVKHESYKRQRRAELGPKTKVARRPRKTTSPAPARR